MSQRLTPNRAAKPQNQPSLCLRGLDSQGFGEISQGFGEIPRGFGENLRGFGENPRGFGENSQGFGENLRGFGENSQGFGEAGGRAAAGVGQQIEVRGILVLGNEEVGVYSDAKSAFIAP